MQYHRATKICATLGPASATFDVIEQLFLAGANAFRLNFSHGSHDDHRQTYDLVRQVANKHQCPIAVMQDLQGPKLRIGVFSNQTIVLEKGAEFRLDLQNQPGDVHRVTMPHPEIFEALVVGTHLLLDDGRVCLHVNACGPDFAQTTVIVGGRLSNRKGVNVPGVPLAISPLTKKDREDLQFGLALGVDYVALSFVQKPEDVIEARSLIQNKAKILSKIEKPQALDCLQQIVELSDGIMVARGDLGVEMPAYDVPVLQDRIIKMCRQYGKPVIVATQMMESMIQAPIPTRAEVSDVARATEAQVDCVMLSAESASGQYPVESVTMMRQIIESVERAARIQNLKRVDIDHIKHPSIFSSSIAAAACQTADFNQTAAIVAITRTGQSAIQVSYHRPRTTVLAITPSIQAANQMALVWGCYAQVISYDDIKVNTEQKITDRVRLILKDSSISQIVVIANHHFFAPTENFYQQGSTNMVYLSKMN